MELISDFSVQEFLNNNISLTERELTPIIGLKNVKTHYNAFKHDIMFTFYDDIHGVDEVAWNLCWNEYLSKWITFYSWIPSFSENIHNIYFSFDRNTSREISKIALNEYSQQNDYIYLDNSVMTPESSDIGTLHYNLPNVKWEILQDIDRNNERFELRDGSILYYKGNYSDFVIPKSNIIEYYNKFYYYYDNNWHDGSSFSINSKVITDETLISELNKEREELWRNAFNKPDAQRIYILNIRATPSGMGSIDRTIAVVPKEHLDALTTDFWKHGLAGIIDITEDIKPTKWYGKVHPFEFEFVVREDAASHKIFDNLVIISNKAEPESFHYEIVGECYDFAKDKKNMYIRQEATKELLQKNREKISYNDNYKELKEYHRPLNSSNTLFEKSTIFPAYYKRKDYINTIEDYYHQRDNENGKDFSLWSGSEIVYYKNLDEFRIWTHSKGVDLKEHGLLRGNMLYKEDSWDIQIPSINYVECNEPDWKKVDYGAGNSDKIPIELKLANFTDASTIDVTNNRGIVLWQDNKIKFEEAKLKDKYIKIRIRYSGEDLAVISAIKTLFSISYA